MMDRLTSELVGCCIDTLGCYSGYMIEDNLNITFTRGLCVDQHERRRGGYLGGATMGISHCEVWCV